MDAQLEKAKIILNKTFCFMQLQADAAVKRGETLMEKEDIEYLLSLGGITKGEILSLDGTENRFFPKMEKYNADEFFTVFEKAQKDGFSGLCIIEQDINNPNIQKIREMGCYVDCTWAGSTTLCYIYFNEEVFIQSKISELKNLFGSLTSLREFFN